MGTPGPKGRRLPMGDGVRLRTSRRRSRLLARQLIAGRGNNYRATTKAIHLGILAPILPHCVGDVSTAASSITGNRTSRASSNNRALQRTGWSGIRCEWNAGPHTYGDYHPADTFHCNLCQEAKRGFVPLYHPRTRLSFPLGGRVRSPDDQPAELATGYRLCEWPEAAS